MKQKLLYLFAASILFSCGGTEVPRPASRPGICYVLCDFSASQDARSRQTIMENALRIFDKGLADYQFRYYDIGAPQFEGAFFEYKDSSNITVKKAMRKAIDDRKKLRRDSLRRQMARLGQEQGNRNTCIMRTLDKIAASLAGNSKGQGSPVKMYILSDMLEDCTYDSARINIDNAPFEIASKRLSQMPMPVFSFKGHEIEVLPVVSSQKNTSFRKLFEFWKQAFIKYDYELKSLLTELPD